jgi:hypothetical protein
MSGEPLGSTCDFQDALGALLGKEAPNLSPSVIARLRGEWEADYTRWQPHVQPDRERVRHGQTPHRADKGRAVAGHRSANGVQAGHVGGQDLASTEGAAILSGC